jgi:tRNA A37 N6-isopentenylltransferase MiaA
MRSLGYEEIAAALGAGDDPADTAGTVITRTQQYAKRQETYFRRFADAVWLDVSDTDFSERAEKLSEAFLGRPE